MTMYFIGLVLPSPLNEKILRWKNFMHERYQCKVGLKSPAHITLVPPFWMEEEKEIALLDDVTRLASSYCSFTIKTKNFSAFKPPNYFYRCRKNRGVGSIKRKG